MAGSHRYSSPEDEYVQSDDKTSLRKLAKKWGIKFGTIAAQSSRHKWGKKRAEYREKLRQRIHEKTIEGESENVAEIILCVQDSLMLAAKHLQKGLVDQDFNLLKVAKISTEAIQNIHGLLNEHYGRSGSDGITAEQLARALDTLTTAPGSESPIPRPV